MTRRQIRDLKPSALKLEGVAREIDAGFEEGELPKELRGVRTKLVERLKARDKASFDLAQDALRTGLPEKHTALDGQDHQ